MSIRRPNSDGRKAIGLALTMLALCATTTASLAAANCARLQAELTRLEAASGSGGKWESAREQQQRALSAAERDAGYFRCGTAEASPKCGPLVKTIGKMQANLRAIDRQIRKSGGGQRNLNRIRKIQATLASPACRAGREDTTAQKSASKGLFALTRSGESRASVDSKSTYRTLPNGLVVSVPRAGLASRDDTRGPQMTAVDPRSSIRTDAPAAGRNREDNMSRRVAIPSGGTFRTLCVRTCDGYFFPVSFSTGKDQFANDAARCGEICPAAETELFVHRNPGGLQDEMVSLAGIPYTDLTNAYRYRKQIVEGCSCRGPAKAGDGTSPLKTIAGQASADAGSLSVSALRLDPASPNRIAPEPSTPVSADQVPAGVDPDTRLNLTLGFSPVRIQLTRAMMPAELSGQSAPQRDGLPVLGRREAPQPSTPQPMDADAGMTTSEAGEDAAAATAPTPPAAVRVVGPEYFVAQ